MFMGRTDVNFVMVAWSYVALRVGHSIIHLTVNRVPPRFFPFAASNIFLLIMWVRLALSAVSTNPSADGFWCGSQYGHGKVQEGIS
jgi:hypothetical protein